MIRQHPLGEVADRSARDRFFKAKHMRINKRDSKICLTLPGKP
jgi:hypothetical protein